jgi:antitoxin component of MazEF toxin-antitoxin module
MEMSINETDATAGRGGGANESGILFEAKKNQSQVAHVTISEEISAGEEEGAEMYFLASKIVYKDVERTFQNTATGMGFTINKRVKADEFDKDKLEKNYSYNEYLASNGEKEVMINDIANLPRHDVIIKRSELGLDQKQHNLAVYSELSTRSNNPMYQTVLQKSVNGLINVPKQVLEQLNLTCEIQLELQMAQAKSQIAAMNVQAEQANLQLEQMKMQTAQMAQGGVEGQPPQQGEVQDQRQAANGPGQGNLAQGISNDQSNANNQTQSDF